LQIQKNYELVDSNKEELLIRYKLQETSNKKIQISMTKIIII